MYTCSEARMACACLMSSEVFAQHDSAMERDVGDNFRVEVTPRVLRAFQLLRAVETLEAAFNAGKSERDIEPLLQSVRRLQFDN